MGMQVTGRVREPGSTNFQFGDHEPTLGRQGDVLTSDYHGRYYQAAVAGKLFHGISVIAGNSIPIYTTTAPIFVLWNSSTDTVAELVSFKLGYVSGTGVAGPVVYGFKDVGNAVGVPLAAFNHVAASIKPGVLNAVSASKMKFSNAATNTIVPITTTDILPANMNMTVITAADATRGVDVQEEYFDGSIIVPPGYIFFPCALLASVSLFNMRLTWIETPVAT